MKRDGLTNIRGESPAVEAVVVPGSKTDAKHRAAGRTMEYLLSGASGYSIQTVATATMAALAAGICAFLGWAVWAMFLGWVGSFGVRDSFTDVSRSYICLVFGIGIGAAGILVVGALSPILGPLAQALTVFGMATIIVSMRKMPFVNIVPSYILGVLGIFALHANLAGIAAVKIAAPSAVGSIGVWLASQVQTEIANFRRR